MNKALHVRAAPFLISAAFSGIDALTPGPKEGVTPARASESRQRVNPACPLMNLRHLDDLDPFAGSLLRLFAFVLVWRCGL